MWTEVTLLEETAMHLKNPDEASDQPGPASKLVRR